MNRTGRTSCPRRPAVPAIRNPQFAIHNPIDAFLRALSRSKASRRRPKPTGDDSPPPAQPRPHGPAADARPRFAPFDRRPIRPRLRASGRPAARTRPTTASGWRRPGSTWCGSPTRSAITATRTSAIFPYRDYVIDAFNAQQAVRPVHDRAARRRPAAATRRPSSWSRPASTA